MSQRLEYKIRSRAASAGGRSFEADRIGRGGFAQVFAATEIQGGGDSSLLALTTDVVAKIFHDELPDAPAVFRREVGILEQFRGHQHIVGLRGADEHRPPTFVCGECGDVFSVEECPECGAQLDNLKDSPQQGHKVILQCGGEAQHRFQASDDSKHRLLSKRPCGHQAECDTVNFLFRPCIYLDKLHVNLREYSDLLVRREQQSVRGHQILTINPAAKKDAWLRETFLMRLACLIQVADALAEVHAKDCVHGDIAPENAMVSLLPRLDEQSPQGQIAALIDFGQTHRLGDLRTTDTIRGRHKYIAPEVAAVNNPLQGECTITPINPPMVVGSDCVLKCRSEDLAEGDYIYDVRGGSFEVVRRMDSPSERATTANSSLDRTYVLRVLTLPPASSSFQGTLKANQAVRAPADIFAFGCVLLWFLTDGGEAVLTVLKSVANTATAENQTFDDALQAIEATRSYKQARPRIPLPAEPEDEELRDKVLGIGLRCLVRLNGAYASARSTGYEGAAFKAARDLRAVYDQLSFIHHSLTRYREFLAHDQRKRLEEIERQRKDAQDERERQTEQKEQAEERAALLEAEIGKLKQDLSAADRAKQKAEEEHTATIADLTHRLEQVTQAETTATESLRTHQTRSQDEQARWLEEKQELTRRIEAEQEQLRDYQTKARSDSSLLSAEFESLKKEKEQLGKELEKEKDTSERRASEQERELRKAREEGTRAYAKARQEAAELTEKCAQLEKNAKDAQQRLHELGQAKEELTSTQQALEKKEGELAQMLHELVLSRTYEENSITTLKRDLQAKSELLAKSETEIRRLEQERDSAANSARDLDETLKDAETKRGLEVASGQAKDTKIAELNSRIRALNSTADDKDALISRLKLALGAFGAIILGLVISIVWNSTRHPSAAPAASVSPPQPSATAEPSASADPIPTPTASASATPAPAPVLQWGCEDAQAYAFVKHRDAETGFCMMKTEVTVGRYAPWAKRTRDSCAKPRSVIDETNGRETCANWDKEDNLPVNCIESRCAQKYCKSQGGNLPHVPEWKRAVEKDYAWGKQFSKLAGQASCIWNELGKGERCDVKKGEQSVQGITGLLGNVEEFVIDGDDIRLAGGVYNWNLTPADLAMLELRHQVLTAVEERGNGTISAYWGFRCAKPATQRLPEVKF